MVLPVVISGAFVEALQNHPYSAIGQAVGELCGNILALFTVSASSTEEGQSSPAMEEYIALRQSIIYHLP